MNHKLISTLAAATIGIFSFASASQAGTPIYTHGASFVAYNAGQANDIDYVGRGVRTTATSTRYVMASLPHTDNSVNSGFATYIRGRHYGQQTTWCSVYAYDFLGNYLGGASYYDSTNNGPFNVFLSPVPSGNNVNMHAAVLCELPANRNGEILGAAVLGW